MAYSTYVNHVYICGGKALKGEVVKCQPLLSLDNGIMSNIFFL